MEIHVPQEQTISVRWIPRVLRAIPPTPCRVRARRRQDRREMPPRPARTGDVRMRPCPTMPPPRPALKNSPILPMRPTAWMAAGILQFGTGQHAPDGATAQAKPPRAQANGTAARVPRRAAPCRATHPRGNPGQAARGATAGRHTSAGVSYTGRASSSLNVTPRKGASPQLRTGVWGRRTPARRLAGARAQGAPDEAFFRARGRARSTLQNLRHNFRVSSGSQDDSPEPGVHFAGLP